MIKKIATLIISITLITNSAYAQQVLMPIPFQDLSAQRQHCKNLRLASFITAAATPILAYAFSKIPGVGIRTGIILGAVTLSTPYTLAAISRGLEESIEPTKVVNHDHVYCHASKLFTTSALGSIVPTALLIVDLIDFIQVKMQSTQQ